MYKHKMCIVINSGLWTDHSYSFDVTFLVVMEAS